MGVEKNCLSRTVPALGLVAAVVALLLLGTGTAAAEKYPPAPQGEDVAFLQLGAVGELVSLELYRAAAGNSALAAQDRKTARRIAAQRDKSYKRLNSLLGDDAIQPDDFAVRIPSKALRTRGGTLGLAARFERLLGGLYLSGMQSTIDPPTRLLLGTRLVSATRNLAVVRGMRGARVNLRALKPLSVEYVGIQFDSYLTIPGS